MKILKTQISLVALLFLAVAYSPQSNASVVAGIVCDPLGSGFVCLASPGGDFDQDTYTYFWESTAPQPSPSSLCLAGPTGLPYCYESCMHGQYGGVAVIDVTVVEDATGDSDTASKAVDCGTGSGGGF